VPAAFIDRTRSPAAFDEIEATLVAVRGTAEDLVR